MIHAAHASRRPWEAAGGTVANRARGEWLCTRVSSPLGRAEPASWHAGRCLSLVEAWRRGARIGMPPAAYQAMAQAAAVGGDIEAARTWAARCSEALGSVADAEDRTVIARQLAEIGLAGAGLTSGGS